MANETERKTYVQSLIDDARDVAVSGDQALDTGVFEIAAVAEAYVAPRRWVSQRLDAAVREGSPSLTGRREI